MNKFVCSQPRCPRSGGSRALEDWLKSAHVKSLAAKTQDGYPKQVNAVIYQPCPASTPIERRKPEPFAHAPVSAIGAPELNDFFDYQKRVRGLHMARASLAVISAALCGAAPRPSGGSAPIRGSVFDSSAGRRAS